MKIDKIKVGEKYAYTNGNGVTRHIKILSKGEFIGKVKFEILPDPDPNFAGTSTREFNEIECERYIHEI